MGAWIDSNATATSDSGVFVVETVSNLNLNNQQPNLKSMANENRCQEAK